MCPADLPEVGCASGVFGEPLADPSAEPWLHIAPHALRLNRDGSVPLQGTTVRLGWDKDSLHVLFVAVDSDPWATMTEHDAPLYREEVVEVFIDTEGDGLGYFEIEVNPNNAVLDGCMRRTRSGFRKDFRWHCEGLRTAVRFIEGGWSAELTLPFSSLSCTPPCVGMRWRVNFTRIDRPKDAPRELSAWSPTGLDQFHVPEMFGWMVFV